VTALTFKNSAGNEFTVGAGRLKLISVEGLESPPSLLAVSAGPTIGGAINLSARNTARKIKVNALIDLRGLDEAQTDEARKAIYEALGDIDHDGIMEVSRAGRTRWIGARPSREPEFTGKAWNEEWQIIQAEFICPRPYFMDMTLVTVTVQFYEDMTELSEEGIEFNEDGREISMILFMGKRISTIENPGNVDAPVTIRFTGPIVNPYIRNQTIGETIRISRIIHEGEFIEIETMPGKREIHLCLDGVIQNGMHYLDLASRFWKLLPGENLIEIGDESPGEGSEASFEFYPHYREA